MAWTAVSQCDGSRYRYRVFDQVEVTQGVFYGANTGSSGANEELDMDIYRPAGDGELNRPVVILAHGGFFLAGSNDGVDVVPLCEDLARMGYVAASISYRLGIDNVFDLETSLQEAVLRGVHDAKAAVRYFRRTHAEEGNPWGIDPSRIATIERWVQGDQPEHRHRQSLEMGCGEAGSQAFLHLRSQLNL